MNPYEPPQTIDPPPLPPVASEVQLEQIPIRTLADVTTRMVLVGRIVFVVWLAAIVLIIVTWKFYQSQNNAHWVTILMIGTSTVGTVLMIWGMIEYYSACDTFDQYVNDPLFHRQAIRRQRTLSAVLIMLLASSLLFIDQNLRQMPDLIIIAFLVMFIILIIEVRGYHQKSIEIMRSFVPRQHWTLTLKQTQILTASGAVFALLCLSIVAVGYTGAQNSWVWLLISVSSLILCVVPYQIAYRQLAREFDQLWP